jgi:hypothetical protein
VSVRIDPEPSPEEREAILAALAAAAVAEPAGWADAALAEGVEQDEPDP